MTESNFEYYEFFNCFQSNIYLTIFYFHTSTAKYFSLFLNIMNLELFGYGLF